LLAREVFDLERIELDDVLVKKEIGGTIMILFTTPLR
jgi:hypothetical protein